MFAEGFYVGAVTLTGLLYANRFWSRRARHVRGTQIGIPGRVKASKHGFAWAGTLLPFQQARKHFLAIGSTGSGKTCLLRLLMQTVLPNINGNGSKRALIYDSKVDLLSLIAGMGCEPEGIHILNPLDARGVAWDLAADFNLNVFAHELAESIIPYDITKGGENAHFFLTPQQFITGIVESFNDRAPGKWTFRDVLNATRTDSRLKTVFAASPSTEDLLQHFRQESTYQSVKATLDTYLRPYRPIAAAWHRAAQAGRVISIRDWLHDGGILVLGNHPKAKAPIRRLNRLLFDEASKALRAEPGQASNDEQTWIFLDELQEFGKVDQLPELATTGRSKGVALVLGFPSIPGIDAVFGKEHARQIIGCAQNLAILHINSSQPDTQKWASEVLGKWEFRRKERGETVGFSGRYWSANSSSSLSERYQVQERWLPSQFAFDLPPTDSESGLTGLFRVKNRFFRRHIPGAELFGEKKKLPTSLRPPSEDFPDFVPRPKSDLFLEDWTQEDVERLGIPELAKVLQNRVTIPRTQLSLVKGGAPMLKSVR